MNKFTVVISNSAGNATSSSATLTVSATPLAPTNLAATASDRQVALTWTASAGATSYHVKRATTSGGPYTQVAAPTSASYTDTGLTNGTTYFYVVTAVNSTTESSNSIEASAKPAGVVPAGSRFSRIGLNFGGILDYENNYLYADAFKSSRPATLNNAPITFDSAGWPTTDFD